MPALLVGAVRFPTSFAPWYVYEATLVASPATFFYGDVLVPDGTTGAFDRLQTDDAVLTGGYCFALEAFDTTDPQTTVQVAVVGSLIPFVAFDTSIQPQQMVSFKYSGGVQSVIGADATKFAAGKVMGRMRNHHDSAKTLRKTAANDIICILTGAC